MGALQRRFCEQSTGVVMRSACVLVACLAHCVAAFDFPAYRLLQYNHEDEEFGSRRTKVDFLASPATTTDTLTRKIILLKLVDVTADQITRLGERENVDAVLVLIPRDIGEVSLTSDETERWK